MSPLLAALVVAALAGPFLLVVLREIDRMDDPRHMRNEGVIIVAEGVIEEHSEPIGAYDGRPIWDSVTFHGMQYRFDHVIARQQRERIGPGELYLEPGLVYRLK